jgi:hypothetical protein
MKGRTTGKVEGVTEKEGVWEIWQSITRHEGRITRKEGCECVHVWGTCCSCVQGSAITRASASAFATAASACVK